MTDAELQQRVMRKVEEVDNKIRTLFPDLNWPATRVTFDIGGVRKAGEALYGDRRIRINMRFLRAHPDRVTNVTAPHEIAHLLSYARFGRDGRGHGSRWRNCMHDLDIPVVARCHDMHLEQQPDVLTFAYRCTAGHIRHLSKRKHNNISIHGYEYSCGRCISETGQRNRLVRV